MKLGESSSVIYFPLMALCTGARPTFLHHSIGHVVSFKSLLMPRPIRQLNSTVCHLPRKWAFYPDCTQNEGKGLTNVEFHCFTSFSEIPQPTNQNSEPRKAERHKMINTTLSDAWADEMWFEDFDQPCSSHSPLKRSQTLTDSARGSV